MRFVITDLDNTLLSGKKEITERTRRALIGLREGGVSIAFATARPARATERFQAAFRPDFVIADNGAVIASGDRELYRNPLPDPVAADLVARLLREPLVSCLTAETGRCFYTNYAGPPWEEGWNIVYSDFSDPALLRGITKVSTECAEPDRLLPLLRRFPELHLYRNAGENWQQIQRTDSTKRIAAERVAALLSLTLRDAVVFGDDHNDVELLRACGVGVAVGNAIPEALAAADFACGTNEEDGVARWIEEHLSLFI